MRRALLAGALGVCLTACDDAANNRPYLEFVGGGFIFNYNVAEAYYGFVARTRRKMPRGAVLEAAFENPAGGPPLIVRQTARAGQLDYTFRSPPLEGVQANVDYRVELRVLDPADQRVVARYVRAYQSSEDQSILPDQPLTTGPSYAPSPN